MKKIIKSLLGSFGYELKKITKQIPASDLRGIGDLRSFFEDIKERGLKINWAVDCGANEGVWTREFLHVFNQSNILMIEPQVEMESKLQIVKAEYSNAQYYIGAVGEKEENKIFTIWPDKKGSSFLPIENERALNGGTQVNSKVSTLPEILKKFQVKSPELIKMDIQGMELNALKGLGEDVQLSEVMVLECNLYRFLPSMPIASEIIKYMSEMNYFIYDICGYGRRPTDGALSHIDFVFVSDKGYLRRHKGW